MVTPLEQEMETLNGMTSTGRVVKGPASNLVEFDSENGLKHTAIVFDSQYCDHQTLNASLQDCLGFMEDPGVDGVLRLAYSEPNDGAFAYPSGTVWSVAEIVRMLSDEGETAGIRAGLELCYLGAEILQKASEVGSEQGIFCHGSLSPWRVLIRSDGQLRIAGYALPAIDIVTYKESESRKPDEDSLRYCPPERLRDEDEDISSDLLALTLIGLELMMSKPVYDGLLEDILSQAKRGEGIRRLYQWRNKLPASVRETLGRALSPDFDARYRSCNDYIYEVHDVLTSMDAEGPSLAEIMKKIRAMTKRGKGAIEGGHTAMLTQEELAELAADLDDDGDDAPLAGPSRPRDTEDEVEEAEEEEELDDDGPRWAKVSRPGRSKPEPPREAKKPVKKRELTRSRPKEEKTDRRGALRDRLKRSRDRETPNTKPTAEPEEEPMTDRKKELRQRLRRSLRDSAGPPSRDSKPDKEVAEAVEEEPVAPAPAPAPAPEPEPEPEATGAAALLARLRGSSATKSSPKSTPPTPIKPSAPVVADTAGGPKVRLEVGGEYKADVSLPVGVDLATAASFLAERYAPVPVNLLGNPSGVFRIEKDGRRLDTRDLTDTIDEGSTIELVLEPSQHVRVSVDVDGDPNIRFETMISTTVPARALIAHLVEWLKLGDEDWALAVDNDTLYPYEVLADVSVEDGATVRVVP
jgi:hypothetical protein